MDAVCPGAPGWEREEAALVAAARRAMAGAYAPYSGFPVGAAVRSADGRVFTGANVENAAYPATLCAEQVAVPAAIIAGARDLVALAVIGSGPCPCTPCGTCRQILFEFAPDLYVVAANVEGALERYILSQDLLPAGFGLSRMRRRRE
jgi:cytidine deaminase